MTLPTEDVPPKLPEPVLSTLLEMAWVFYELIVQWIHTGLATFKVSTFEDDKFFDEFQETFPIGLGVLAIGFEVEGILNEKMKLLYKR